MAEVDAPTQALLALFVVWLGLTLTTYFAPYDSVVCNEVDRMGQLTAFSVYFSGLVVTYSQVVKASLWRLTLLNVLNMAMLVAFALRVLHHVWPEVAKMVRDKAEDARVIKRYGHVKVYALGKLRKSRHLRGLRGAFDLLKSRCYEKSLYDCTGRLNQVGLRLGRTCRVGWQGMLGPPAHRAFCSVARRRNRLRTALARLRAPHDTLVRRTIAATPTGGHTHLLQRMAGRLEGLAVLR